ncbi:MAG: hypothetical protein ACRC62_34140 [Microcoleus sp.]
MTTINSQLSTINRSRAGTLALQLSTFNYQLSTINRSRAGTLALQLSTINCQLSIVNSQLSTLNSTPITNCI